MNEELSLDEYSKYARHLNLPGFGIEQQRSLLGTKVLVVGVGGLGVPVVQYLAAAGVGSFILIDGDVVSVSNLHRQVIYDLSHVGFSKVHFARQTILKINPEAEVLAIECFLTVDNALGLVRQSDIVLDCTDNFATRYLINDACSLADRPYIYASVYQYEGHVAVFNYVDDRGERITYRDVYPYPPRPHTVPDCAAGGVIGALPGMIGSLQALEAIKVIAGIGRTLAGRLFIYDGLNGTSRTLRLRKTFTDKIDHLINYEEFCGLTSKNDNTPIMREISVKELNQWREEGRDFELIDVREAHEVQFASIGGKHIPLGYILARASEVESDKDVVVMCRSGARSANAISLLASQGFENLYNLKGGILAWADEIDPSIPKY